MKAIAAHVVVTHQKRRGFHIRMPRIPRIRFPKVHVRMPHIRLPFGRKTRYTIVDGYMLVPTHIYMGAIEALRNESIKDEVVVEDGQE